MKYADILRRQAAEARAQVEALDAELRALLAPAEAEERRTTTEEDTRAGEIIAEVETLNAAAEADEARAVELDKIDQARDNAPNRDNGLDSDFVADPSELRSPSAIANPWNLDDVVAESRDSVKGAALLRGRAIAAAEKAQGLTPARRETLTKWVEAIDAGDSSEPELRFLRHIIATSAPDYQRNWVRAFKAGVRGGSDPEALGYLQRAMSLTDNAGGYAVPQQLDPTLILTSDGTTNPIRQIARKVVATGDVWTGLSTTHASWSFDAEAAEVSDDSTTFAQPSVTVRTARGFIPFSLEVQMDYPGFTDDIAMILANGKDDLEATVFATGASGSNQPVGIVTALTGGGSVVASATADTLAWADVTGLNNVLPAKYRSRASWIAEARIISEIREDAIAAGYEGSFIDPQGALPGRLLDSPMYEASTMDGTYGSGDNYVAVLGDFSNYVIADRVGFSLELVPHLFATANNLPSGQRGFFAHYRVGADSVNDGAFRMLNVT